jgi:hypothetical protein
MADGITAKIGAGAVESSLRFHERAALVAFT